MDLDVLQHIHTPVGVGSCVTCGVVICVVAAVVALQKYGGKTEEACASVPQQTARQSTTSRPTNELRRPTSRRPSQVTLDESRKVLCEIHPDLAAAVLRAVDDEDEFQTLAAMCAPFSTQKRGACLEVLQVLERNGSGDAGRVAAIRKLRDMLQSTPSLEERRRKAVAEARRKEKANEHSSKQEKPQQQSEEPDARTTEDWMRTAEESIKIRNAVRASGKELKTPAELPGGKFPHETVEGWTINVDGHKVTLWSRQGATKLVDKCCELENSPRGVRDERMRFKIADCTTRGRLPGRGIVALHTITTIAENMAVQTWQGQRKKPIWFASPNSDAPEALKAVFASKRAQVGSPADALAMSADTASTEAAPATALSGDESETIQDSAFIAPEAKEDDDVDVLPPVPEEPAATAADLEEDDDDDVPENRSTSSDGSLPFVENERPAQRSQPARQSHAAPQLPQQPVRMSEFQVGDVVEAKYKEGDYFKGEILSESFEDGEHMFAVKFIDGDVDEFVAARHVREWSQPVEGAVGEAEDAGAAAVGDESDSSEDVPPSALEG